MRHRALILAVAFSFVAAPRFAAADPSHPPTKEDIDQAGRHFKRGVDLFRDSDFGGALVEFRRAQQLAPNYRVLFNMGQALFELQKYAEALHMLEQYLEQGGNQIPKERRAQVEADIDKLRARVATLDVVVDVSDAEIAVDGEVVGKSPLAAPLLVSAGRRSVTVSAPAHVPVTRVIELAGGDQSKLAIELAPVPSAAPPPVAPPVAPAPIALAPAAPEAPPEDHGPVAGMWIGWATTGVLVAATAVTGALTLSAKSDFNADLRQTPGDPNAIADARSRGRTLAGVSTGLGIGAVVAAGVSTYLTVRVMGKRSSAAQSAAGMTLGLTPAGIQAAGAF